MRVAGPWIPAARAARPQRAVRLFFGQPAPKTFLIDRRIVFVGSLNLDPRSMALNTEQGLVVESESLAEHLARSFELATGPGLSYRVQVERTAGGRRLVWHGEEDGRAFELYDEPGTHWWNRFGVCLLGMLPIQGQL